MGGKDTVRLLLLAIISLGVAGCAADSTLVQEDGLAEQEASLEALEEQLADQREALGNHGDALDDLADRADTGAQERAEILERQAATRDLLAQVLTRLNRLQRAADSQQAETQTDDDEGDEGDEGEDSEGEADAGFEDKLIVGQVEQVRLTPPGRVMEARIDTGANTSSLDARDVQPFERDGEDWVRFKVYDREEETTTEHERPVVRRVRIISSSEEDDSRPVVELQFELGPIATRAEFTLANREGLSYPVLIGRNILRDLMVVDVAGEQLMELPAAEETDDTADDSEDASSSSDGDSDDAEDDGSSDESADGDTNGDEAD